MPPRKPRGGPEPTGTASLKIATASASLQNGRPLPVLILGQEVGGREQDGRDATRPA
jgi:hypothetical protein